MDSNNASRDIYVCIDRITSTLLINRFLIFRGRKKNWKHLIITLDINILKFKINI